MSEFTSLGEAAADVLLRAEMAKELREAQGKIATRIRRYLRIVRHVTDQELAVRVGCELRTARYVRSHYAGALDEVDLYEPGIPAPQFRDQTIMAGQSGAYERTAAAIRLNPHLSDKEIARIARSSLTTVCIIRQRIAAKKKLQEEGLI